MPVASNASFSTARLGAAVLAATLASACKFPYPPDVPDDGVTDSDATTACAPSTIVCDDARGEYVACSAAGTPDVVLHCPLGCAPDEEKCLDIDPHNGLAMYLDMARTSPLVTAVAFSGTSEIDPVSGTASSGGNSVQIPSVMAGSLRVFMVRSLVVRGNLRSKLAFSAPSIAIVSAGDITIEGTFDVSADAHRAGAGFYNNRCPGGGSMMAATTTPTPGGGGGGGSTAGAQGGANSLGMAGFPGGARLSGPLVEPLERGCDGGYVEEEG